MKNIKVRIISFMTIFCILSQFIIPFNISNSSNSEEIYDVILFWGQSNMVGYCGKNENEKQADTRYDYMDSNSVKNFSSKTGIEKEFFANSSKMNFTKVKPKDNTAYEYKYTTDSLVEITEKTEKLGQKLLYNSSSKKLETTDSKYSIQKSYGTNMIPQFCKTYYEKTGRKVVAVFAANGGETIQNFLPSTDEEYGDTNNQMIYEAMVEKYKAAINYMKENGLKVKNKMWVCFQGEANVGKGTSTSEYKRLFLKVHNYMKNDIGISKGAIVESSYKIGTEKYSNVKKIGKAQEELAYENEDIIIGSSYAYRYYIPDEKTYNSSSYSNDTFINSKGEKISYEKAFDIASSSVCYPDNTIHFTSAALSQMGKETAENLAKDLDKVAPEIVVEYSTTKETNKDVKVTIKANEMIQEKEGWALSEDRKSLSKIYTENKGEQIAIYDLAGNITYASISVMNIDKISPEISVTYSETKITNKGVEVIINANERIQEVEGWALSDDKKVLSKTYTTNISEKLTIYDLAGNSTLAEIKLENIDKEVPNFETTYSTTRVTNEDVEVTIKANKVIQGIEGWTLSNDKKSLSKIYTENKEEQIEICDLAGNKAKVKVKVANIDKISPEITVTYSETKITNKGVEVIINANERIQEVEGWALSDDKKVLSKTYTTNISEKLTIYDLAGNSTLAEIKLENIDKEVPNFETTYSTTRVTNEDVEVTIKANKVIQGIEGWTLSNDKKSLSKIYTENKEEQIEICDLAGNKAKVKVKVANIDKVKPKITVTYSETKITNKGVEVIINANEKIQETEGWTLSDDNKSLSKTYVTNKTEKLIIYDLAGNGTQLDIEIENIDKEVPNIEILYSTTKITNKDVEVTIKANKVIQEIKGWTISDDKKSLSKIYTENKEEKITISDIAGNRAYANIKVTNIDKIEPEITVKYSEPEITKKEVEVTIIANEKIREIEGWSLSEDEKILTKTYTVNKKEEIIICDLAGNEVKVKVSIDNIKTKEDTISNSDEKGKKLPNKLPNAGIEISKLIILIIIIISAAVFYKKNRNLKDIK